MINSKTPTILITCAVMLVLCMVTLNMTQYLRGPGLVQDIEAPNKEAIAKLKERQSQAAGPNGARIGQMKETSFGGPKTPDDPLGQGNPATPSIQIPSARLYKPTFDPNTTSAQWYDEESYQKVNAEKNAGKRTELGGDD